MIIPTAQIKKLSLTEVKHDLKVQKISHWQKKDKNQGTQTPIPVMFCYDVLPQKSLNGKIIVMANIY